MISIYSVVRGNYLCIFRSMWERSLYIQEYVGMISLYSGVCGNDLYIFRSMWE